MCLGVFMARIDWNTREVTAPDGARLAVFVHEPAGLAPDATTIVMAHGWTLDHRSWEPVAERLAAEGGRRIVAWDQRGHGGSSVAGGARRGGEASVHALGDDLALVIEKAVPEGSPIILAGHSMGGMTIMAFAGMHPDVVRERVTSVVLVATSAGQLRGLRIPGEALAMRALSHIPWRPGVFATTRSQRIAFGQDARKEDVIAARAQMRGTRLSTTGSYYKALMAHDELAALESLKDTPVTILVGTRDMLTPPRHAKALAEALPDADAQFLEGKGHMLTYEAPDEVAAAILRS